LNCKYYTGKEIGKTVVSGTVLPLIECSNPALTYANCEGCQHFEAKKASLSDFIKPVEARHNQPDKIKVGITTSFRTEDTLDITVQSLLKAGFDPSDLHIFYDNLPSRCEYKELGIRQTSTDYQLFGFPNFIRCLSELLVSSGRTYHKYWDDCAYLVVQDDVRFCEYDIKSYLLNEVLYPSPLNRFGMMSLYLSSHYKRINDKAPGTHPWVDCDPAEWINYQAQWYWGAPAMLFSRQSALKLLRSSNVASGFGWYFADGIDDGNIGLRQIDYVVGKFCKENRLEVWQLSRSLCDHIGVYSSMWCTQGASGDRSAYNTIR
jgi:hypothetical protein